jgi:hypothetical protein
MRFHTPILPYFLNGRQTHAGKNDLIFNTTSFKYGQNQPFLIQDCPVMIQVNKADAN